MKNIVNAIETTVSKTENIVSLAKNIVCANEKIGFDVENMFSA